MLKRRSDEQVDASSAYLAHKVEDLHFAHFQERPWAILVVFDLLQVRVKLKSGVEVAGKEGCQSS